MSQYVELLNTTNRLLAEFVRENGRIPTTLQLTRDDLHRLSTAEVVEVGDPDAINLLKCQGAEKWIKANNHTLFGLIVTDFDAPATTVA